MGSRRNADRFPNPNIGCQGVRLTATHNLKSIQMKITYFKSVNDTGVPYYTPIETAIDRIRTGKSKTIVENVRKEIDKTKRNVN